MYGLTCELAQLGEPPVEMRELVSALQDQPEHIARFLGAMAGSVAVADFFGPDSITAVLGQVTAAAAA
jgi:hypothetical protein